MSLWEVLRQGDAVSRLVALTLLAMSVGSWVVILWKGWLLQRSRVDVARSMAAFWQCATVEEALRKLGGFDRQQLVLPLIEASRIEAPGTLAGASANPGQRDASTASALSVNISSASTPPKSARSD